MGAKDTFLREGIWSGSKRQSREESGLQRRDARVNSEVGTGPHGGSPWPGGVRLTAWARAASTDCSASPRRSRPLRALGERAGEGQWACAHLSNLTLYTFLCSSRLPDLHPV